MLCHFRSFITPATSDGNVLGTHGTVVRVSPATEGIGAGRVAVRILNGHGIASSVFAVNGIALSIDQTSDVLRQRHTFRDVLLAPVIGHLVLCHFRSFKAPATSDGNILGTHGTVVRVCPTTEGIGAGRVAILVFNGHGITSSVFAVDGIALTIDQAGDSRRQLLAVRDVLRAPLIGHLVHTNIHIGAIIQLSVVKVALSILQASLCISCIVRVIQTALIEGGVGIYLDGEANHQLLASPRLFLCIIDYRMAAIVKPADIDCLACNRDCNVACRPF